MFADEKEAARFASEKRREWLLRLWGVGNGARIRQAHLNVIWARAVLDARNAVGRGKAESCEINLHHLSRRLQTLANESRLWNPALGSPRPADARAAAPS